MKRENQTLCIGISPNWGMELKELLVLVKEIGFDGFFVDWNKSINIMELKQLADKLGLKLQSIHAPYINSYLMWENHDGAKEAVQELLDCLEACYKSNAPIMVCHAIIGFDRHTPNEIGVENFKIIADRAKEYGIKIALENTEGEEYLAYLMDALKGYENVGFCWDTGHEMCYNKSKDMLELYGDRLICTHINDNLGITDMDNITWTDDLHLLPFDGIGDWTNIAFRLDKHNYNGELTFELSKQSKPNRHENDKYDAMDTREYVTEIYKRACKFAELRR